MMTISPAGGPVISRCASAHFRDAILGATLLFVLAGGQVVNAQTLPEGVPDFSLDTARPGVQTVQSGSWSNPATWQGGVIPTANHIVRIAAAHTVTINDTAAAAYTV